MGPRVAIVVEGEMSPRWISRFEGLSLRHESGRTILEGWVRDSAALYGHLVQLRDLGVELVAVSRLE